MPRDHKMVKHLFKILRRFLQQILKVCSQFSEYMVIQGQRRAVKILHFRLVIPAKKVAIFLSSI